MPHQLMGECAADTFEQHRPDGMLEHTAVASLEDIGEILAVGGAPGDQLVTALEPGIRAEAQIAQPARELGNRLRRNVGVAVPVHMLGPNVFLSREQCYFRLAENMHG